MGSKLVVWNMVFAMIFVGLASRAEAGFSPSRPVTLEKFDREADLEVLRQSLEKAIVAGRLHEVGYTSEEIDARLELLTDAQVHRLATDVDEARVGQGPAGVLVAVLVVVVLVLLIIYLVQRT